MVAGELAVVDRTLLHSTLKKLHVDHVDSAHAKAVRRAAKAIRADVFVSGVIVETPDGVQITVRLISPGNSQPIGATRGVLPKGGPLSTFLKRGASATDYPYRKYQRAIPAGRFRDAPERIL